LDISAGVLTVASRLAPAVTWRQGAAESLPFEAASFDAVVSQFGLMFFANRVAAIQEMLRILVPGGRLALAVWDALERTPGYAALVALLQRLFGDSAADALRAPFALGDPRDLSALLTQAGVPSPMVTTQEGTARFLSIKSWISTEVKGWSPLGQQLTEGQFAALLAEAERVLVSFVTVNGTVEFVVPAHIVTARKV
jgi:SAM-dependent methyltransferase